MSREIQTKYLIVGNSAAAVGGVEGIRRIDPDGKIVLVSDEPYHTYPRPLISYWLEGRVDREHMRYRGADFYKVNRVDARLGEAVTAIDAAAHTAKLAGGERIVYEKALIATGSKPFVPPIDRADGAKNAFTFTKLDDALAIGKRLTPESRVVIMGGGLIGLKAAEAVLGQCASLTVVDLADRVMPSVLDAECAAEMADHLRSLGVDLRLKTSLTAVTGGTVTTSEGDVLPTDILILAVGTRPNQQLAADAGAACERGIVTDTAQCTSLADVYAAGDCTQSRDISAGVDRNIAILPNAYLQGETAGINMAGGAAAFEAAFPVNAMGIKDFYLLTAGSTAGEPVTVRGEDGGLRKFYIADDRLVGFIILGDCQRAGIYTDMIRNGTKLSLADWEALLKTPQLAAFEKDVRLADLARVH